MNVRLIFFILLYLSLNTYVSAQRYEVKDFLIEKSISRGASYIGLDNQGFIYASSYRRFLFHRLTFPWIKVFDSNSGTLVAEKRAETKALKQQGYRLIDVAMIDDKPVLIVRKRGDIGGINYYAFDVDKNLNLLGGAYKIGERGSCRGFASGSAKNFNNGLTYFKDKNGFSTFLSDLTCSGDDEVTMLLMRLNENNNEIYSEKFSLDIPNIRQLGNVVTLADKTYFTLSGTIRKKVDHSLFKQNFITNHLFVVDNMGYVEEINLSLGKDDVASEMSLVKSDGKILVSGQIIRDRTTSLQGVFTAAINEGAYNLSNIATHYFDHNFITKFWSERDIKRAERRGRTPELETNFVLIDKFDTDDGGAAFISQKRIIERVSRQTTGTGSIVTTDITYYYYYTDIIVTKINASGNLAWVELIPMHQMTVDYDPGKGFVASQKNESIFLMHLSSNEIKDMINEGEYKEERRKWRDRRTDKIVMTEIDKNGNVSTNEIIDTRETKVSFNPSSVAIDHENKRFTILSRVRGLFTSKKTRVKSVRF